MVDNLKRLREPAGWALLVVTVASMVVALVRLGLVLTRGELPVYAAFADIAVGSMNLTLVAALVAVVCLCLFIAPPTPRAVPLARAAAIVVTVGALLTLVATGIGVWAAHGVWGVLFELLGGLVDLLLKLLAAVALWIIARAVSGGRLETPALESFVPPQDEAPPVWQPSQASGSVWKTAADAASGAQASGVTLGEQLLRGASDPAPGSWTGTGRPGAAEALGWRRVDEPAPRDREDH